MTSTLRRCALGLLPLVLASAVACGGKHATTHAAASIAAARPTASADARAATVKAETIVNGCAVKMGGTSGPGVTALVSLPVLQKLATKSGRATFGACVFPDPAKRTAGVQCLERHLTLGSLFAATKKERAAKRAAAAQAAFNCVEANL